MTKNQMLGWARFLVDVAAARIPANAKVEDVPSMKPLFPQHQKRTVKELFAFGRASDVQARQRAVGVLFHMIQDSYAHGHVERNEAGDIVEFHAYGEQDEHEHGKYDYLGGSWYETLGTRLKQTQGAPTAIDRCADVLTMIAEGKGTDEIVRYLDATVFKLASATKAAGPGTGLKKKP